MVLGFFPAFKNHPIRWNDYLGKRKGEFCPKLSCGGEMWGAEGSLKNYVQTTSNTGSHGVLNTPDLQLVSCCICYHQHRYYSPAMALTGEGTQAGTSF